MKRILGMVASFAILLSLCPASIALRAADTSAALITKKFDLGGEGAASGYIGVSASETYTAAKGYGFKETWLAHDVSASGSGALSDAVHFQGSNGQFMVDLPAGVYTISVTTGDVVSVNIVAEGIRQLCFMTGNEATDSFTIPITDGQLNIYANSGRGTEYSISAIEIQQISTGTTTKPTIWICGDEMSAKFYNVPDDSMRGWGEYLYKYVDTNTYDIRNVSRSGIVSSEVRSHLFPAVETYGKSGDILLLSVGYSDYAKEYLDYILNGDPIESDTFIANVKDMVDRAKAKGMTVYIVRQQGTENDPHRYPLPTTKYFNSELDAIAAEKNVAELDLMRPWLEVLLLNYYYYQIPYYTSDETHLNATGADKMASIVAELLFPHPNPGYPVDNTDYGTPSVIYETEVSGEAVKNPHKGFVMTGYSPYMIDGDVYGVNGSANNQAWNVVTIVSGSPHWNNLNPEEGVYNWDEIDAMLDKCEELGMTYGIRIMPYSSYLQKDFVPQWVYDKGAQKNVAQLRDNPSQQVTFPKWDDPIYIQAHKDFVKALAEKYDGDPRVEFIDVRPFGDFGEWHNSFAVGDFMPSISIQKDMLDFYANAFDETLLALPSNARGEIYRYAISLGITKRDDGLICEKNVEWSLIPAYEANMPVLGENLLPYDQMLGLKRENDYSLVNWTPQRFRETIEVSHLSIFALDQDSHCSYNFYLEQKDVIDEMCNRLGYNYTVTSAAMYGKKLVVKVKNTGLAPSYFYIDLHAEITDANGNKIAEYGTPIRIEKGTFHDGMEKTFIFEYAGELPADASICLAMYDCDNPLAAGKDPTVRFDNKNTLPNNRLKLVTKWVAPLDPQTGEPLPIDPQTGEPLPIDPQQPVTPQPGNPQPGDPVKEPSFEEFIDRLYRYALLREPEADGKAFWMNKVLNEGFTGGRCAYGFLIEAKEFLNRDLTNEQFIDTLYLIFFDRAPDTTGKAFWLQKFSEGMTREQMVNGFIDSTEWCNLCASYGIKSGAPNAKAEKPSNNALKFATRLYTECLGRQYDADGLQFWALRLTNLESSGYEAALGFFTSEEFKQMNVGDDEFIHRLYRTFMGRDEDADGFAFWKSHLGTDMTREDLVKGFAQSQEFTNICNEYGIDKGLA